MDFENQEMLEEFFNKRQTLPMLKQEFLSMDHVMDLVSQSGLDKEFCLDLLSHMALGKRYDVPALTGLLRGHFMSFQETAEALEQAAKKDLVDFSIKDGRFIVKWDVSEKAHQLIRQYRYLPPMIVPPLHVSKNRGSGYTTIRNDSLILKDNHHDGDLCLDSINRFNQIPLTINEELVKTMRNKWKHMDSQKNDESFEDYMKRVAAFEKYEKDSFFTIALMIEMGNVLFLTHKYDKRGRTYCCGYHCTYQGADWNKACIEFADKEKLN
jgi:hypothetical protein